MESSILASHQRLPHIVPACLTPAAGRQGVPMSPGFPGTRGRTLAPSNQDVPRGAPLLITKSRTSGTLRTIGHHP